MLRSRLERRLLSAQIEANQLAVVAAIQASADQHRRRITLVAAARSKDLFFTEHFKAGRRDLGGNQIATPVDGKRRPRDQRQRTAAAARHTELLGTPYLAT